MLLAKINSGINDYAKATTITHEIKPTIGIFKKARGS